MKVFVTGAHGRLGSALVALLKESHEVVGVDVKDFDITDFSSVRESIWAESPELVIHPAAWTDVDGCARDPDKAVKINGFGAQNVAVAAAGIGAAIVYVSSNEVFDGQSGRPFREYDRPQPINPYAYSKWIGEQAVAAVNPRHYIVRTAWLFAHGGRNFIQSILGAAEAGKTLRVVTDEVANPTYNDDLADAIVRLVGSGRFGTYHLVNEGAVSRYAFARHVLDLVGYKDVPITPITRAEWPRPGMPPAYTALSNTAAAMLGIRMRPWQQAVKAFLEREGLLLNDGV